MGLLDVGVHTIPRGHLPLNRADAVQRLRQAGAPVYMASLGFTAYGIHWFAMAYPRDIDSGAQPDGWMAIAFLFLSILDVDVVRRAGDIPVMLMFVGLALIYATEIPTRLLSWSLGGLLVGSAICHWCLANVLHHDRRFGVGRQTLDLEGVHIVTKLRGNDPAILIGCEDITEHKNSEEKVWEQEARLLEVLDYAPQHIAVLGPDVNGLYLNQAGLDYHGITLKEWQSSTLLPFEQWPSSGAQTFFHPDDWERIKRDTRSKFLSGSPHETEGRLVRRDGTYRWFLFRYNPMRDEQGGIARWYVAAIDIEDRKQAEKKLQQSEAYLREAQRVSHMGSWAHNLSTGALFVSPELLRIFGRDPQERPTEEIFRESIHPDDRPFVEKAANEARNQKTDFEVDHRIVLADGSVRHVHSVSHPVLNDSGDLVEFIGTIMDVTERKQAEEALRLAQGELAHMNRATTMGELSTSLAHEVNQPIAAAVTDASTCLRWLARDQPDLGEARLAAARTVKDAIRAGEIIRRIRWLFKKGTPQRELLDVNEVIQEMVWLLRDEAKQYSISIRTELANDLSQVMGDRVQLQQVLMNLMINGIDAMKDRAGTRELVINSQRADNVQLMVSVSDSGRGLPPQKAEQVFTAFFTTKRHGVGMGLRISRSIVEGHGGRLWATDNSPHGACFCFTLPTNTEDPE
jgi:PAS domain S-box-containing protein